MRKGRRGVADGMGAGQGPVASHHWTRPAPDVFVDHTSKYGDYTSRGLIEPLDQGKRVQDRERHHIEQAHRRIGHGVQEVLLRGRAVGHRPYQEQDLHATPPSARPWPQARSRRR